MGSSLTALPKSVRVRSPGVQCGGGEQGSRNGKAIYFGRGIYREALGRYNAYLEEQRHKHGRERAVGLMRALLELPTPGDPDSDDLNTDSMDTSAALAELVNHPDERVRSMFARSLGQVSETLQDAERSTVGKASSPGDSEISQRIDEYLAEQRRRHELTKKQPEALPPKRRLGVHALRSIKESMEAFRQWANHSGRVKTFGDSHQTERILKRYRQHLEEKLTEGEFATSTVSNRLRRFKPFMKWLWQNRYIDDMPRNVDDALRPYAHQGSAKAIRPEDVRIAVRPGAFTSPAS